MKKHILSTLLLLSCLFAMQAQNGNSEVEATLKTFEKDGYFIQYPAEWEMNETGMMGTSFIIMSKQASDSDMFRENVNLLIQDLTGMGITLDQFVEISTEQVKTVVEKGNLLESERLHKGALEYHKMVYTAESGDFELKFLQYYFILNDKAFILTFTAETTTYEAYKSAGERVLNSFRFK
jgi:hypothetical protein